METKTLWILRGVSGSGKSTLAGTLENALHHAKAIAADDFWYKLGKGVYEFDIKRLAEAHGWCRERVICYMELGYTNIILHNTNTSEKEIKPYFNMADRYGYKVVSLVVENRHRSNDVHNVPTEVKVSQENRLRSSLKL